jgi:CheY-like chemotaxis protein
MSSEFEVMAPETAARYTVMVVDDDPSVLDCYRRLLGRAGYNTLVEADPCRVLSAGHADRRIDLLLLDHKMPGMDGLALLAELRRRDFRARCILVSAFLNDEVRTRARLLGVDRVLEKPVDVALLRSAIHDLLPVNGGRPSDSVRAGA